MLGFLCCYFLSIDWRFISSSSDDSSSSSSESSGAAGVTAFSGLPVAGFYSTFCFFLIASTFFMSSSLSFSKSESSSSSSPSSASRSSWPKSSPDSSSSSPRKSPSDSSSSSPSCSSSSLLSSSWTTFFSAFFLAAFKLLSRSPPFLNPSTSDGFFSGFGDAFLDAPLRRFLSSSELTGLISSSPSSSSSSASYYKSSNPCCYWDSKKPDRCSSFLPWHLRVMFWERLRYRSSLWFSLRSGVSVAKVKF